MDNGKIERCECIESWRLCIRRQPSLRGRQNFNVMIRNESAKAIGLLSWAVTKEAEQMSEIDLHRRTRIEMNVTRQEQNHWKPYLARAKWTNDWTTMRWFRNQNQKTSMNIIKSLAHRGWRRRNRHEWRQRIRWRVRIQKRMCQEQKKTILSKTVSEDNQQMNE